MCGGLPQMCGGLPRMCGGWSNALLGRAFVYILPLGGAAITTPNPNQLLNQPED